MKRLWAQLPRAATQLDACIGHIYCTHPLDARAGLIWLGTHVGHVLDARRHLQTRPLQPHPVPIAFGAKSQHLRQAQRCPRNAGPQHEYQGFGMMHWNLILLTARDIQPEEMHSSYIKKKKEAIKSAHT